MMTYRLAIATPKRNRPKAAHAAPRGDGASFASPLIALITSAQRHQDGRRIQRRAKRMEATGVRALARRARLSTVPLPGDVENRGRDALRETDLQPPGPPKTPVHAILRSLSVSTRHCR